MKILSLILTLILFSFTAFSEWKEVSGKYYYEFSEQSTIENKYNETHKEPLKNTPAHSNWLLGKAKYIQSQVISAMVLSAPSGVVVTDKVTRSSNGEYKFVDNNVNKSSSQSVESFFEESDRKASVSKSYGVKVSTAQAASGSELNSTSEQVTTKELQAHFCKTDECRENVEKVIQLSADLQTRCELIDNKIEKVVKSMSFKQASSCESHFSKQNPIISNLTHQKLPGDFTVKYRGEVVNELKVSGRCEGIYLGKTDSSKKPGWGSNHPDKTSCLEKCEESFAKLTKAAAGDWVGLQCIWGTKVVRVLGGEPTLELCELVDRNTGKVIRSSPAKSAATCKSRFVGSNNAVIYQLMKNDEAGNFEIRFNQERVGENVFKARCSRIIHGLNDDMDNSGSGPVDSEKNCLDSCHAAFEKESKRAGDDWRGLTCKYGQKTLITLGGETVVKLCELIDLDDNNKVVYTSNNSSKEACIRQTAASNTAAVYARQKAGMPGNYAVHFNGEHIGENKFEGKCNYSTVGAHHYLKVGGSSRSPDTADCLKKCEAAYKTIVKNNKDEWRGVECAFGNIKNGEGIHLASFGGDPVKKECEFIDNETNTSLSKVQTSTPSTCKSRYSGSNPAVIYKKRIDGVPGDYIVKWNGEQIYRNKFGAKCISESIGTRSSGGGPSDNKDTCLKMCKETFERVSKNPPKNWRGFNCYFGQTAKSKGTLLETFEISI